MLDMIGKIFEQVVAERPRKHFWGKRALSANHYGFSAGSLAIDAAGKLKKVAASAIKKCQFGAAVSLDIQSIFNLMLWMRILRALVNAKVPVYLCNMIRDYFREWMVFAPTALGMVRKEMTCGVPKWSVLGPRHWNTAFDNILKEEIQSGSEYCLLR